MSCLLMQDAVAADAVRVAASRNGVLTGKVALFANPYAGGKEEALAINSAGNLTYLQRTVSSTGWDQTELADADGAAFAAAAVVVVIHPLDLSVWAIYSPAAGGAMNALQLVGPDASGTGACAWQSASDALPDMFVGRVRHLSVAYESGRSPRIMGLDTVRGDVVHIWPTITAQTGIAFGGEVIPEVVPAPASVEEFVGSADYRAYEGRPAVSVVCYARSGSTVTRYTPYFEQRQTTTVATDAAAIVGVYPSFSLPDVGCLYLTGGGDLVSWNLTGASTTPVVRPTTSLNLAAATAWLDADQMLHVYGLVSANKPSRPGYTLKVLHQASWDLLGEPVWVSTLDHENGFQLTDLIGLSPHVAGFALDPFPDYRPSLLVHRAGTADTANQFTIDTQDPVSARWSRDKVRLPASSEPALVNHYVSTITVLDGRGAPMPNLDVMVSAETMVEIQVGGASHLVGPGYAAPLKTNLLGKIAIATAADSLLPATLHVDAVGLEKGLVVQPATAVHDYLAGTGTLPSQKGLFDADGIALYKAEIKSDDNAKGKKIVGTHTQSDCKVVAGSIHDMFRLANDKNVRARDVTGREGPAGPRILQGFAVGPGPKPDPVTGRYPLVRTEFTTPAAMNAHLEALRAHPDYGGVLDDLKNLGRDIYQGVKSGAVSVYKIVVDAGRKAVKMVVYLGGKLVELAEFIVDSVGSAVRAVESFFRLVVADIPIVVDWLKSLFDFDHILNTAAALESGLQTIVKYTGIALDHYKKDLHGWFTAQKGTISGYLQTIKDDYLDRPPGDAANLLPAVTDPSRTQAVSHEDLRDNPQSTWLLDRLLNPGTLTTTGVGAIGIPSGDPIASAFEAFLDSIHKTDLPAEITKLIAGAGTLITQIVDPADPAMAAKASTTAVIDVIENALTQFLEILDRICQTGIDLALAAVDVFDAVMNISLAGPLDDLYQWMQSSSGIAREQVATLTLGRLVCLLGAFAATVAYKLANGATEEPFPGGEFPILPIPSWDPDDAVQQQAVGVDGMTPPKVVHAVLASINGSLGTFFNSLADYMPMLPEMAKEYPALPIVVASCNMGFNVLPATVLAFPWLNGKSFSGNPSAGASFALAGLCGALCAGTIAMYWKDQTGPKTGVPNTPAFKNLGAEMYNPFTGKREFYPVSVGPFIMGVIGVGRLICAGADKPPIAAALDLAAGVTSGAMIFGPAVMDGLTIPQQGLRPGNMKKYYEQPVAMTGDHVFNIPMHWECLGDDLPPGLSLDQTTGMIYGTPTKAGTFDFQLSVRDSSPPPQTAVSPALRIVIS